jgi:replicative DNA helicase
MVDHELFVLAGIIPGRRDHLLFALQHLEDEHFRKEQNRHMFRLLERYYSITADILPRQWLSDLFQRRSGGTAAQTLLYEELYDEILNTQIEDHEFLYAIDALKDIRAQQLTGEAITQGMEVLERGLEVEGEELFGHEASRTFLYEQLAHIDKLGAFDAAPEGDMRQEARDIEKEYADRQAAKDRGFGIMTGIKPIDDLTSGFQNGELIVICGYTGEGKSMFAAQCAWRAAVEQKKNVFFATSETVRPQVRRRILARHSRQPQFAFKDGFEGFNTTDLKNASLGEDMEVVFHDVVADLEKNPEYGKLYIAQIPRGASLGYLEARLQRQQAQWNIDLLIVDYLALIKPDRKRMTQREELSDILKDAKVLATSFNHGVGVPLLSPWAMSQTAWKEAKERGQYSLANLADTSEAEKSSDVIISMLGHTERRKQVLGQLLKNRDGGAATSFDLTTDYRCAYLAVQEDAAESLAEELDDMTKTG